MNNFESQIETLTLLPADGGRFEVRVNKKLVYSKLQTHRHPNAGEVASLVRGYLQEAA